MQISFDGTLAEYQATLGASVSSTLVLARLDEFQTSLAAFGINQGQIMNELDDLNTKVTNLETTVESTNAKADLLIAGNADLRAQIVLLQNQGGATPAELAALALRIDAVTASLTQQAAEDDAALASTPATPGTGGTGGAVDPQA